MVRKSDLWSIASSSNLDPSTLVGIIFGVIATVIGLVGLVIAWRQLQLSHLSWNSLHRRHLILPLLPYYNLPPQRIQSTASSADRHGLV
ncbi:hypothetical protein XA68_15386 [Ophiocordyceps unilateralis]|uniref:Uncharacterized protein n=1 Tax=Ophiocordyceps unilateralis TaxID=268505 RepID=A0A2A9P8P6_OPHUN|nr:hypothetical protein XA68_15386 [Ophiocordyceps unilateralis]